MIEIKLETLKNNKREWWIIDNGEKALGFEKLSCLKDHFKHSLKIDKNKKVEVLDKDRYLQDIIFL